MKLIKMRKVVVCLVIFLLFVTGFAPLIHVESGNADKKGVGEQLTGISENFFRFNGSDMFLKYRFDNVKYQIFGWNSGYDVKQTVDGGYAIAGSAMYADLEAYTSYERALLIKTDGEGIAEWNNTFTGLGLAISYSVDQTQDNGYILVGDTAPRGGGISHILLLKVNQDGQQEWMKDFYGNNGSMGGDVCQTSGGGYVVVGSTATHNGGRILLLKTDINGDILWNKTFGEAEICWGRTVHQTADGGFILSGLLLDMNDFGPSFYKTVVIKTDDDGNIEWNRSLMDNTSYYYTLTPTNDGGYILSGIAIDSERNTTSVKLLKLNSQGNTEWDKTFLDTNFTSGSSVLQTSDGGYIIGGSKSNSTTYKHEFAILIKTDASGNEEWRQFYKQNEFSIGTAVAKTANNGYIMTGETGWYYNDFLPESTYVFLLKTDESGNEEWTRMYRWVDSIPPQADIIKPVNALYIKNEERIPLFITVILGQIDIIVNATDGQTDIYRVEFYIDDKLMGTDTAPPYEWTWDNSTFFKHKIKIVAYDDAGNVAQDERTVWIFNLQ